MPIYQYEGLSEKGESKAGLIDADSPREARARLRGERIHVTTIQQMQEMEGKEKAARRRVPRVLMFGRVSWREVSIVTRQLAVLLGAGIPLSEALGALIQQIESRRLEAIYRDVREKITQGSSFADALSNHPNVFSELYVNMVRAGEESGNLDTILKRLAEYMQKQARLRSKLSTALTYPVFMTIVGVGVVTVLVTFVVPRITQMLEDAQRGTSKYTLPLPTKILISTSELFQDYWWLGLAGLAFAYFAFRSFISTERGARMWDRFKLNMPVMGVLFRKAAISRFAVTLATLIRSGLHVTRSLRVVRNVVGNKVIAETLDEVHDRILEGADIATPIKKSGLFPPIVGYMVAIGEQSGQLDDILERLAEAYDEELEETAAKVTSIIEPLIIVLLAIIVGFIIFAIILPLLQIAQAARG